MVVVAGKVPSYFGVRSIYNIKNVTLESVHVCISSLSNIFDVIPITFKAINKVVALTGAITDGMVYFLIE